LASVTFLPDYQTLEDASANQTVRELAKGLGVSLADRCGGLGACYNCVVRVIEGDIHLSGKTDVEAAASGLAENERLACQCRVIGSGRVVMDTTG
jgi:ferredoxin